MKVDISPEPYYFGTHRWNLNVVFGRKQKTFKTFLLGQDAKFTSRVLGCDINELFDQLKIKKWTPRASKKVANYIVHELELNSKILKKIEVWELCCE